MADETEKPKNPLRALLKRSRIVASPMSGAGWRTPLSKPKAAEMYLDPVRIVPCVDPDGTPNPEIWCELFEAERSGEMLPPAPELDPGLLQYAADGKFEFKGKRGLVQYVVKGDHPIWPERYTLRPTFSADDLVSLDAAEAKLDRLMEKREKYPRLICLEWTMVLRAVESEDPRLYTASRAEGVRARFYQRRHMPDESMELWVGYLPEELPKQEPKDGKLKVSTKRNGVVVCLSADFLEQLLLIVKRLNSEIELLYKQLYVENE